VNGCQTSHVLYDNAGLLNDSVTIPFRLISTQDEGVIESVIRATNRQTEVRDEQFFAMKDFAKKLEEYFKSFAIPQRLYYERRPHQYDEQSIEKYFVVTHQNLVRAFGAMFLGEPHITTRNYRQLSAKVGKEMFRDTDKCEPYYVAALALSRIEEMFKLKVIDPKFKPARYQILLAMRLAMDNQPLPRMNSNEMARRCTAMMESLWGAKPFGETLQKALDVVFAVAPKDWDRDSIRTEPITNGIFERFGLRHKGASDGVQDRS
jgi:AIPR protein